MTYPNLAKSLLFLKIQNGEQIRGFKNLFRGCLFAFVKYFCNHSPKMKTKNFKNYADILILAIVNYLNWMDALPLFTWAQELIMVWGERASNFCSKNKLIKLNWKSEIFCVKNVQVKKPELNLFA